MTSVAVFWFRRDLRLHDNAGLYHALKSGIAVLPIFIFDTEILDNIEDKQDKRVSFIDYAVRSLHAELKQLGTSLQTFVGKPIDVFVDIISKHKVTKVFTNLDYESYALQRDSKVHELLKTRGIEFSQFKDHVIFDKSEVLKADGSPYTVFTPYSKKWKSQLTPFFTKAFPTEKYFSHFAKAGQEHFQSAALLGFDCSHTDFPSKEMMPSLVANYADTRDFPSQAGTSRLSVHLRFGTLSIRELVKIALEKSDVWLTELIWRDFFMAIVAHFPWVETKPFRPAYENIPWRNDMNELRAWCEGKTGYPIVDAGMRELNATGFMHNRVRMICASFCVKHLLIDYRLGEKYFSQKLLDFELASNNGNWQWVAGTGCDASPFFRIFNPGTQAVKFDKKNEYIRKWVPEFDSTAYQKPIVEHSFARERALFAYAKGLGKESRTVFKLDANTLPDET